MNTIHERQRSRFYIYKKEKFAKLLYIYKNPEIIQNQNHFRRVCIYKNSDTLRNAIFMNF